MTNIDDRPWTVAECEATIVRDEDGQPRLVSRTGTRAARFVATLLRILGKATSVEVIIRVIKDKKRSPEANNLLWASYRIALEQFRVLALEAGRPCPFESAEDIHEWAKLKGLGLETVPGPGGVVIEKPKSTVLAPWEFWRYYDWFVAECSHHHVYIPPPSREDRSRINASDPRTERM